MADTRSRQQLIYAALGKMGVTSENRPPYANEVATIDDAIDPLVAQLYSRKIANISNTEAIELDVFDDFACLLANNTKGNFGIPNLLPGNDVIASEIRLREITFGRPSGAPVAVDYF
jgi:hypothetical protein